ncbi:MAG TPA: PAS domain S-box protein, partial [Desulfurivibrionaceae bacterium]|nr:PAS domain S-box protein [Desulfurivibrionaceae bacterium]
LRMLGTHTDITKRKQAEEALKVSEQRFRSLLEDVPTIAVQGYDRQRRIVFWNTASENLYGFSRHEALGKRLEDLIIPPAMREGVVTAVTNWMTQGIPIPAGELLLQGKGGKPVHVFSSHAMQIDADGEPVMYCIDIDLAERNQAQEMLHLFKVLVENASDAIGMSTPEGKHYYQNAAFTALFGEIGEDPPATLYVDQAVGREVFQTIMAGGRWTGEVQMYTKDKAIVNVLLRAYANKDQNGRVIGLVGVHTDITERKRAEEALKQSEIFIRTVLDNLPIGIAVNSVDPTVDFAYMNDNFPRFYRTTREAFATPDSFWEAVYEDPEVREAIRKRVLADCASGDPGRMQWEDVPITRKGQETTYIIARNTPIPGQGLMISTVWDVTERKRAEEEKERLQTQLLQAQKMESVGRLAGGVAHDFNNMLHTILGYCDLTLKELTAESPLKENLVEIHTAACRSADLTRQLLAFARKQAATPKIIDLNDTVGGMLKMLQRLIGENIDLAWMPGHDLWRVKIDPSQLDQILANLAVNARDAIADTGKITIATDNIALDDSLCAKHPECAPGEYVLLSVNDTGCGMDHATLEQIFEPFFTTKEMGKGTGLGLATVYGIVRQNNGLLTVESSPGNGTTFRIYLPRVAAEPAESLPSTVTAAPLGGTETVLLVEDEEAILKLGKTILIRSGYTVLATNSADEALRLAQEHPGPIHLLITDVVMPEMNGRELARQLSANRPDLACLYMSGYTADIIARHGVLEEGMHFLQKPFSVHEFATAVRQALQNPTKREETL